MRRKNLNTEKGTYETLLIRLIAERRQFDRQAERESQIRWDSIGKPIDGLGRLEKMISKIAGMTGTADVRNDRRAVAVMCADNGVVAEGVTQTGQEITALVAETIAEHRSAVCLMAQAAGADVFAVDIGIVCEIPSEKLSPYRESSLSAELPPSGIVMSGKIADKKIASGTENIAEQAAMSREQAACAVCRGIETVKELKDLGYQMIASGEMGIGNTTTSSAAACCLTGLPPEQVTGRGAGLAPEGVLHKIDVVNRAISLHRPDASDALDVLSKVGGYDIAGMTGLFIGGAIFGIPVIIDGVISAVSAVLADLLCPGCRDFMLASHLGKEPAAAPLLERLGLIPVIHAQLALGEGTGAVTLLPLLDTALRVYAENITFEDIDMDAYERMD